MPVPTTEPTTRELLPAPGQSGKDAALVAAMFDRVAPRYDLANTVLSLGQDRGWRRAAAVAAEPTDRRVLDVASGTGRLAQELVASGASEVVALDLSARMLAAGASQVGPAVRLVNGDALRLPFPDASFDALTIGFGLRNLPDASAGLREFARVVRPGGRLVVLEFAAPTSPVLRAVYTRYLIRALPRIAEALSPSPTAYRYLAESILRWPSRTGVAAWMRAAGWAQIEVRDLSGGIVAIHRGTRNGP